MKKATQFVLVVIGATLVAHSLYQVAHHYWGKYRRASTRRKVSDLENVAGVNTAQLAEIEGQPTNFHIYSLSTVYLERSQPNLGLLSGRGPAPWIISL